MFNLLLQFAKHKYLYNQEKILQRYPTKDDLLKFLPKLNERAYEREDADKIAKAYDYTYLIEGKDSFPERYNEIRYLALESVWDGRQPNENDPTGKVSVLFDFLEKKAYYRT